MNKINKTLEEVMIFTSINGFWKLKYRNPLITMKIKKPKVGAKIPASNLE